MISAAKTSKSFNKSGMLPDITSPKASMNQLPKLEQKSDIIAPMIRFEMWDLKEKSSTSEVMMQYQIIKLEENHDNLNKKLT